MKRIATTMAIIAATALTVSAQKTIVEVPCKADQTIRYWNNAKAPHSNEQTEDEYRTKEGHFRNTSETVFYLYKAAPEKATGQSIVVLPGGGYGSVCIEREGFKLAEYFQSLGVTALVVKYRLPNDGHKEVPLEDAQAALAYMRKNAKKLGIDPQKVGIAGSSAGGHLAATASTLLPDAEKPAFAVLFYPVINGETCLTHQNTFRRLLGAKASAALRKEYSLDHHVSATTPQTILLLSTDDRAVPPINSIRYYKAMKYHGVNGAMHIYPEGGHGWVCREEFRYDKDWRHQLGRWLKHINEPEK